MTKFTPFRCVHFHMEADRAWAAPVLRDEGYYVVVWWKSFPLGDFYIKAGERINPEQFEQRLSHAIFPALKHYDPDLPAPPPNLAGAASVCEQHIPVHHDIPSECDASVVICTRDRAESLGNCLESLMNLLCKPAEIIVVDNASKDDNTRLVCLRYPSVRYLREDRPGLDIARNTGAKAATCPVVAFTDDDTLLHPLWVYHVHRTFDDPSVEAMTGLVLAHELRTEAQWIFENFWPFNRGYVDKRYDHHFFNRTLPSGPPVWNIGAGANMAFRRSAFARAGYFDERLDVGAAGCNGDSEMWYRILANGGAIHYNPRAVVSHIHRDKTDNLQKQIFSYMRGFTAAVLIQHQRFGHKGNLRHLFYELPKYYVHLLIRGFPLYRNRYTTIFSEMRGMYSGLIFYIKNRNTPSNTH
jgi:glycosyltransferase involved in cell wall biosynthesis